MPATLGHDANEIVHEPRGVVKIRRFLPGTPPFPCDEAASRFEMRGAGLLCVSSHGQEDDGPKEGDGQAVEARKSQKLVVLPMRRKRHERIGCRGQERELEARRRRKAVRTRAPAASVASSEHAGSDAPSAVLKFDGK